LRRDRIPISARSRTTFTRVTALGRAHDFVRPHSANSRPHAHQNSLHGLLEALFLPYQPADAARIRVSGTDVAIDDRSATPLALLFHELATNAVKYGALSNDSGHVAVTIDVDADQVSLTWHEHGGPAVSHPATVGFGAQLIDLSATRQLGGTVVHDWAEDGLRVVLKVSNAALSRG